MTHELALSNLHVGLVVAFLYLAPVIWVMFSGRSNWLANIWLSVAGGLIFYALVVYPWNEYQAIVDKASQVQGEANWKFVGCLDNHKVQLRCQHFKNFSEQVQCMSARCGRPNAKWTTLEMKGK